MERKKKTVLKPKLSIAKIGKLRFWSGIILGIFQAVILFFFSLIFIEVVKAFNVLLYHDLYVHPYEAMRFEKVFLIATATALGTNMMIRYWFMQPSHNFLASQKRITLRIINHSLFLEQLVLFAIIVLIRHVFIIQSFRVDTNIYLMFYDLLYIIPIYIFISSWTEVFKYFKAQRWLLYISLIGLLILTSISFIDITNHKIASKVYKKMHEESLRFTEATLNEAKKDYTIEFNKETINTLNQMQSNELLTLLRQTKIAFESEEKVDMKHIILEKILLHNFKGYHFDTRTHYFYVYPIDIYRQLKKVNPASNEAKELISLLQEFYNLTLYTDKEYNAKMSDLDRFKTHRFSNVFSNYTPYNSPYRMVHRQTYDCMHGLILSEVYEHPFIDLIKSDNIPPLLPLSPDVLRYQKEFPEFEGEFNKK